MRQGQNENRFPSNPDEVEGREDIGLRRMGETKQKMSTIVSSLVNTLLRNKFGIDDDEQDRQWSSGRVSHL